MTKTICIFNLLVGLNALAFGCWWGLFSVVVAACFAIIWAVEDNDRWNRKMDRESAEHQRAMDILEACKRQAARCK